MAMGVYCVKCKHKELEPKFSKWPCMDCCDGDRSEPITNYDLLISKTPEELAETYAGGCPNGDRLNCGKYYLHGGRDCFNCWLDWLKSPAEPGEVVK